MTIDQIIELFKRHKFKIKDISTGVDERAYYTETENMQIGIFDYTYPNTGYNGKILIEHKDNFDKWSKVFYSSTFPNTENEFKIILRDLNYIDNKYDKESGNNLGSLTREF